MTLRPCAEPGCPELVSRTSRCPVHTKAKDVAIKVRTAERRRIYFTKRWRGLRRTVLREQPWCAIDGCHALAREVDHIVPLRDGIDPYDRSNLQGLCSKHHSQKTAREVWHT